jgi:hydroxymethylglutaryl-CoA lyase
VSITINEVVLRDGLQDQPVVVATDDRLAIAGALIAAGLRHIEAVSFVNPERVPQMSGAEELASRLPRADGVRYSGIALNARGVRRAVDAGIEEVTLVLSATEAHSRANAGRGVEEAIDELTGSVADHPSASFTAGIAVAFVDLDGGEVAAQTLVDLARRFTEAGVTRIALADTMGTATADRVLRSLDAVRSALPGVELGLHLHNARGQAMATVDRALAAGVTRFDSAAGGYGGCPFAPGAAGNIATERLVARLRNRGIATGIDERALAAAVLVVRDALARGTPLFS